MYCETRPQGEKSSMVAYRTPGLELYHDYGSSVVQRGIHAFERLDTAYEVVGDTLYEIIGGSTITAKGTLLTTTGRVSIADNGMQVMIVDGIYGYIYTTVSPVSIASITRAGTTATLTTSSAHGLWTGMQVTITGALPAGYNGTYTITVTSPTTWTYTMAVDPGASAAPVGSYVIAGAFARITDSDFPSSPLTVTYLDGRFVVNFSQSSRFYWSDINDGYRWDALNFANAETSADPILAVWTNNGQLGLLGSRTMEWWGSSGALDSPFTLIQGTASEWGLGATWSVCKYDNSLAMLIRNRMGQVMVAQMNGYLPQKISTPDIDSIINSYSTTNDASTYSYMLGGHPMFVINFPTAEASWLYDGSTGIWSQLKSFEIDRHRAEFGVSFLTYTLVADFENGNLYSLKNTVYTDNGEQIESIITSETLSDPDMDTITIDKFRVDMQVGNGTSTVENPQIGLMVSRDNGNTFGNEVMRNIGPIGTYSNIIDWTRLGTARNMVFRLRVTDPVPFTLVNAIVNPEQ